MANFRPTELPFIIRATTNNNGQGVGRYELGSIGKGAWGVLTIHLLGVDWSGSIVVKARGQDSNADYLPIPYRKLYLNNAVGDGTVASTTITDTSIIQIDSAAGLDIALDCTVLNAGSMKVMPNFCES